MAKGNSPNLGNSNPGGTSTAGKMLISGTPNAASPLGDQRTISPLSGLGGGKVMGSTGVDYTGQPNTANPPGYVNPHPYDGSGINPHNMYSGSSEGPGGFTGHIQDPNRGRLDQQPQLSQQDMINTRNRINELSQYDPRYPTPFAGRNESDPRNGEMDVLTQRMNQWHQQQRMPRMGYGSPMPPRRFDGGSDFRTTMPMQPQPPMMYPGLAGNIDWDSLLKNFAGQPNINQPTMSTGSGRGGLYF